MVDLSDVIGKAVGGDEGAMIDTLIDMLRRYYNIENGVPVSKIEQFSDTDIVLQSLLNMANELPLFNVPDITTIPRVINRLNEAIERKNLEEMK